MNRYIFVADEMGTPGMAPGTSASYVFGGYVVRQRHVRRAVRTWRKVKLVTCGSADVELKWKHFFVDANDTSIGCPLLVKNRLARRGLAALALKLLFHQTAMIPAVAVSRKSRATAAFITQSRKGKPKIDADLMWLGPVGLFATFLSARHARGKLWFDELGNEKHQLRWQTAWFEQLRRIRSGEPSPDVTRSLQTLLAIDENIEFFDSKANEAIQIAVFVCGVIWQATEGDEAFLDQMLGQYGPEATGQGLGILHLE